MMFGGHEALFQQREHAGRRADLQRGGKRAHVRIADEQVQTPVFTVVREGFVARVDDGAVELHPLVDVVDDVVGALADLEVHRRVRARHLEIKRQRVRLPDPARAGENLPRGQEREQRPQTLLGELRLALHQIILVAAEGRPGVVVDVVLEKRHLFGDA